MASAAFPVAYDGVRNHSMNAVRFLAAFLVVIFHLRTLFIEDFSEASDKGILTQALYGVMSLGHQAVIVFFVLSGFWVGGSVIKGLTRQTFSVSKYALARLVRLQIVLIPAIVLTLGLDLLGRALSPESEIYLGSEAYHSLIPLEGVEARTSPLVALGNALFMQDIYTPTFGTNSPLWSLAAEFWYYVAFPAVLVLFGGGGSARWRVTAGAITAVFAALVILSPMENAARVVILAPTWVIGAIIAVHQGRIRGLLNGMRPRTLTGVRGALGAATLAAAVIDSRIWNTGTTYLLATVTACWLASLITDAQSSRGRRVLAPLSRAAEWSYSLYAVHMPVLALLAALFVPHPADRWVLSPITLLACLGISCVPLIVASVFWLGFERNTSAVRAWITRG